MKTFNNFPQAVIVAIAALSTIAAGFITGNITWFVLTIICVLALAIFTANHGRKKVWGAK